MGLTPVKSKNEVRVFSLQTKAHTHTYSPSFINTHSFSSHTIQNLEEEEGLIDRIFAEKLMRYVPAIDKALPGDVGAEGASADFPK